VPNRFGGTTRLCTCVPDIHFGQSPTGRSWGIFPDVKLSLIFEMQTPLVNGQVDEHRTIHDTIEQVVLADAVGFHTAWFVEHHFLETFSLSTAQDVLFGALSQRTQRIRLGYGAAILPYHHPVMVAERVALVDHLTNGRIEFGSGRGGSFEQVGFGVDPRDSRDRWDESLAAIARVWTGPKEFSWDGKFWQVPPRTVVPKPLQRPHPPMWLATSQLAGAELAADRGLGVLAVVPGAPAQIAPDIAAYRERIRRCRPVGAFVNEQWADFVIGHCGSDNRAAVNLGAAALKAFLAPGRPYTKANDDTYRALLRQWGGVPDHLKKQFGRYLEPQVGAATGGGDALVQTAGSSLAIWEQFDPEILAERGIIIAGDPGSCIEGIRQHEAAGADEMLILMQTDVVPHEQVMRSIETFGHEVIPAFQCVGRR
jgi:alkanesulfonate monooxygenase SsuD/methylene tetrahydromethanopterin reductase-like flavin-dependent oxidoreductase (luciferase family)